MSSDFEIRDGILEKYVGNAADVVVPDGVTVIGAYAFAFNHNIVSIKIPEGVTLIRQNAFDFCSALEELHIPDSVTAMEKNLFMGCEALKRISFSKNCEYYQYVFEWNNDFHFSAYDLCCMLGNGDLTGPDNLIALLQQKIKDNRKHVISGIAEKDNADALRYLLSLYSKVALATLNTWITAMEGKPNTTAVLLAYKEKYYTVGDEEKASKTKREKELGEKPLSYADWRKIFKISLLENGDAAIAGYKGTATHVDIPSKVGDHTVVLIKEFAFEKSGIISIRIADTVKTIEHCAFRNCSQLTEVVLPEGLAAIGEYAFQDCIKLKAITIPGTVSVIQMGTFRGCRALRSVVLNNGIKRIASHAFDGSGLQELYTPSSVDRIDTYAFFNCKKLHSVSFSEGVRTIGLSAFQNCSQLVSITVPQSVSIIEAQAFEGTAWIKNHQNGLMILGNTVYGYKGEKPNQKEFTVPEGIVQIGNHAFSDWEQLETVILPESLKTISNCAFMNCCALRTVVFPKGLTTIEGCAFLNCKSLKKIELPAGTINIGGDAFGGTAWYEEQPMGPVYLCNILYEIKRYTLETAPADLPDEERKSLFAPISINIPEGTVAIANTAFKNAKSVDVITIPSSLKRSGSHAFWTCTIEKLYISDIGNWCAIDFELAGNPIDCSKELYVNGVSVHDIVIPGTVKKINKQTFYHARPVYSVVLEEGVEEIDKEAFAYCGNMRTITIASSVKWIHEEAFAHTGYYTIHTPAGSYAEQFAKEHGIRYDNGK